MPTLLARIAEARRTTTFRLTALLGGAFVAALCGLLGGIFTLTEHELLRRTDGVLEHAAVELAGQPVARLVPVLGRDLALGPSGLNYFALFDASGHRVVGTIALPRPPIALHPVELAPGPGHGMPLRMLARATPDGGELVLARDIAQIADLRRSMLAILVGAGLVTAIGVGVAAALLSVAPLRRIRRLNQTCRRIAAGELGLRMPLSPRDDELDLLAGTVNAMMDEIERLLAEVKGATDAIAHDLRAPLGHVRTRLEHLRARAGAEAGLIATAIEDLDRVLGRFNALLRISELEASHRRAGFGPVDPMAIVTATCELYGALADDRDIHLHLTGEFGLIVEGDEMLLFEALGNLVDNAIKFIPRHGTIRIGVHREAGNAVVTVADNGPGIPPVERAVVLDRFRRGSTARHVPGSGLGLNLVAAIAHLHGFALELGDAAPGLSARIIAPLRDGSDISK